VYSHIYISPSLVSLVQAQYVVQGGAEEDNIIVYYHIVVFYSELYRIISHLHVISCVMS